MRAVIRAGAVTLVPAEFATVRGGPGACLARAALDASVSIADIEFGEEEDDELAHAGEEPEGEEVPAEEVPDDPDEAEDRDLEVRFLANDVPGARSALRRWAARAGHRRIWFRDQVVDLESPPELDGEFATTCPTCDLEISDSGPELTKFVHEVGHFPLNCFVCGTFVPQWEPVRTPTREEGIAGRIRRGREVQALRAVED
jgi:hypothetical protein